MAKFQIIIEDIDDGLEIHANSDVEITDESEITPAIGVGFAAVQFLQAACMSDDENAEEVPSLEVVGETE